MKKIFISWVVFLVALITLLYKLDYPYFFTDEILYTEVGNDYVKGDYSRNLQHPLLGKYFVGIVTLFGPEDVYKNNVFWLRFPYAILGALSSVLVYLILRKEYSNLFSIIGAMWYVSMPFLYDSTRMVMFEAPLHFFFLLFHLSFFKTKNYIWAGIFMGLALGTKIPALILVAFSALIFLTQRYHLQKISWRSFAKMCVATGITFGLTYTGLLLTQGITGLKNVIKAFMGTILQRNEEGKEHLVGNTVYSTSPWWFYLHYIYQKYDPFRIVTTGFSVSAPFIVKDFFTYYWGIFFGLSFLFFQAIPLKNDRYISTLEIPVVMLSIPLLHYLITKFNKGVYFTILASLLIFMISIYQQKPTKYHALRIFLNQQTNNYANFKKTYIFGSVRSARWYKQNSAEGAFVFEKDPKTICPLINTFDFLAFDLTDLLRSDPNQIYLTLKKHPETYDYRYFEGFDLFIKKAQPTGKIGCDK